MSQSRATVRTTAIAASLAGALVLVPAAATGAGPGRPEPKSPAAARAIAENEASLNLINAAEQHVRNTRSACGFQPLPEGPRTTLDTPDPAVTGAIAALRRPQTPTDQVPPDGLLEGFEGEVYVSFTRTVTAPDGKQFVVVPARETPAPPRPASCADAVHERLLRTTARTTKRVRSITLRRQNAMRRNERRAAARPRAPYDEVLLFSRRADGALGSGGGGGAFRSFLTHGSIGSSGVGDDRSTVTGLLPDGVASVTMTYPRRVSRGRDYAPKVFPRKAVVRAPVQDNVFSVRVPRSAPDAFPSRTVWRAADGHVVRVVRR